MTSNLGSQQMKQGSKVGFDRMASPSKTSEEDRAKRMRADVMIEVERYFRPEFLNRVDELVVFNPLNHDDLARIVHLQLNEVRKRLGEKGVRLELDQASIDFLIKQGYSEDYGARPLRRAIERFIEDPLAEHLLRMGVSDKEPLNVRVAEDGQSLKFEQSTVVVQQPVASTPDR
jgi:ATP-dependent Clp protease ATP-binding subunit ClpC